jgi:hypothetical protein
MKIGFRLRSSALLFSFALALPGVGYAADEKCNAQCDEESDRCMMAAGKDSQKQRQCDAQMDECLRKCS